MQAYNVMLLF